MIISNQYLAEDYQQFMNYRTSEHKAKLCVVSNSLVKTNIVKCKEMAELLVFIAESYRGCRPPGCCVPSAVMSSITAHDITRPGQGARASGNQV